MVVPGRSYKVSFWTRGDETTPSRYGIFDFTHGEYITGPKTTGVSGTTWTLVEETIVAPTGCISMGLFLTCGNLNASIAYFDDASFIGLNYPLTAKWSGTPILGRPGIGDGKTSSGFDKNNYIQINNLSVLNTLLNGDCNTITIQIWFNPSFSWSTYSVENCDLYTIYGVAGTNIVNFYNSTTHKLTWRFIGGGVDPGDIDIVGNLSGWHCSHLVITGGTAYTYLDGIANGSGVSGLGTFSGPLDVPATVIGNAATGSAYHGWLGNLAHFAIWKEDKRSSIQTLARI